jgi:hypothetical protein
MSAAKPNLSNNIRIPQFLHDDKSVSRSHFVTAMTFNIGDADITTDSKSDVTQKYKDNIFIKLLKRHFDTNTELPDILIIGLQEVPRNRLESIQQEFEEELQKLQVQNDDKSKIKDKNYTFIKLHDDKPYITLCNFDYKIVTIVLVSDRIRQSKIDKDSTVMYCPGLIHGKPGTKGFTLIKLDYSYYNQPQPSLYIINLHAPFKTFEKTTTFFNKLFENFTDIDTNTNNIIIMGDYNSRSLITKFHEYIKDVDPSICSSLEDDKYDEDYCEQKSELESMPATNNRLFGPVNDSMISNYVSSNSFKTLRAELKLKEYPLQFYPSYKRQTQKQYAKNSNMTGRLAYLSNIPRNTLKIVKTPGQFSLEKGNGKDKKYRLPGYADRITVLGSKINLLPETNMYTTIPVIGNDHIPVVATFVVPYMSQSHSSNMSSRPTRRSTVV